MELILADMETVTKRLGNLQKEVKANKKEALIEAGLLERIKTALTANKLANTVEATEAEAPFLKSFHLLTSKPVLYVLNKKGNTVVPADLIEYFKKQNAKWVAVDAATEHDMKDFSDEDKKAMREGDGGIDNLIKAGYELLGLITYFTTGEKETRAWTIVKGWTAPMAGTAIHNDFKDKFIKADVIFWEELLKKGNWRTEGKEYIVKDGDVMEFKI
jgi:ribosome-binding ATPase YchF (GTP1/OBG family)